MRHWILGALVARTLLTPLVALAHGEHEPGPHGGVLRMPGAFHTEVVAAGEGAFRVYLLDVSLEDPVVADSTVELWRVANGATVAVRCTPSGDHFACRLREGTASPGALRLRATRRGWKGSDVTYPLPLRVDRPERGHR